MTVSFTRPHYLKIQIVLILVLLGMLALVFSSRLKNDYVLVMSLLLMIVLILFNIYKNQRYFTFLKISPSMLYLTEGVFSQKKSAFDLNTLKAVAVTEIEGYELGPRQYNLKFKTRRRNLVLTGSEGNTFILDLGARTRRQRRKIIAMLMPFLNKPDITSDPLVSQVLQEYNPDLPQAKTSSTYSIYRHNKPQAAITVGVALLIFIILTIIAYTQQKN